ncbi:MAG: response regulator transcription factor, partial [Bacilli bacterium]
MDNKILVVDDEESISTLVEFNLKKAGYRVTVEHDGLAGLESALKHSFDAIILDVMLPRMDGVEICKELRARKITTPIMMLTAKTDELDKVLSLELGADDYITKPFSPRELVARVKAMLRRSKQYYTDQGFQQSPKKILLGDLTIIMDQYEVYLNTKYLDFTPKEFELLAYLAQNKGRVLTRDQLLNAVWNYDFTGDTRIVDVHISHLRDKIEADSKRPQYIKTIRGLGYKMEEPKRD